MKTTPWRTLLSLATFIAGYTLPPVSQAASPAAGSVAAQLDWRVGARTACSTERLATEWTTNVTTGAVSSRLRRYTEVGTGLNYLDPSGQWRESQDLIELTDNGAAAVHGPHKVYFSPNLNTAGAVTLVGTSNRVFKIHVLGLYYYDASSGKSVLLSTVKDSIGELMPPNQVIYQSAFTSLEADVRYTYTKAAFESDVILRQKPKPPEAYGLNPATTCLELLHEYLGTPVPNRTPRVLKSEADANVRARMAEPDFIDETLDFGDLWFPQGRAFLTDNPHDRTDDTPGQIRLAGGRDPKQTPVAKRWWVTQNRNILIEAVRWPDIKGQLEALPTAHEGAQLGAPKQRVLAQRELPSPKTASAVRQRMKLAKLSTPEKGFVLDYITVSGSTDYTFESGETYYLNSSGYFSGLLTFQAGTTIKYDPGVYLLTYGSAYFEDTNSSPSLLTSKDEDLFGETIPGSTGAPGYAANQAIWLYQGASMPQVAGTRVRWAHVAIQFDTDSPVYVSDAAVEFCESAVNSQGTVYVYNSTKCSIVYGAAYAGDGFTDICGGDGDSDGLSDAWEMAHFGNFAQDGSGDYDSDGVTNLTEYRQGRNPTVAGVTSDTGNLIKLQVFTPLK